jgi:adenylosuccinate synthase
MAKYADIVIGANFGDEGKGLVTDYLAAERGEDTLVVRHNGGAQAGHTVTTPDNMRHVFKHFGSGSFSGAKTYLSSFFVCNPILFLQEQEILKSFGLKPKVYVDPDSPVTTPYDMMINQIVEEHRANGRHGSCGVGFGETVERTQAISYALYYSDLACPDMFRTKVLKIRNEWVSRRLQRLGIVSLQSEWKERIYSEKILEWFLAKSRDFFEATYEATLDIIISSEHVVFEGAQGLLLDQDHGWFPHVTRSHTGIRNALHLARACGIEKIDVTYVTRAYCTRHGAGPLPNELLQKPYTGIHDATNIHNQYQGSLRFAYLDMDLLLRSVERDLEHGKGFPWLSYRMAVTCLDQADNLLCYTRNGKRGESDTETFIKTLDETLGSNRTLASFGPTRKTMEGMFAKQCIA